jgi:hypothetical protein
MLTPAQQTLLEQLRSGAPGLAAQPRIARRVPNAEVPLGLSQERLLRKEAPLNHYYLMRLQGRLDVQALEAAGTTLVRRHENLRTLFPLRGGQRCPEIGAPFEVRLDIEDLGHVPNVLVQRLAANTICLVVR